VNKVPDQASVQFYVTSHQFEDFKRFFREVVRTENKERAYRVELGGVGDTGVRFLPDPLFPCLQEVSTFFRSVAADFEKVKDESYAPPYSTINFGKLRQLPGVIAMNFDLRLLPDLVTADIERHVQEGVQVIAAKYPSLNVTAVRERSNPGLNMTREHELVKICEESMKAAGIEPLLDKKATSTEAAQYFQAGYEAVVFGPGLSAGNSHSPNEYNILDHLEKATAFYERVIERTCL
jgi:acetylornithine deacetylase/succinyl-diaminopimelate desuccinylase-like protein